MRRSLCFSLAVMSIVVAGHVLAEETSSLGGDEITALVKGKRLVAERGTTSVRMRFNDDGALSVQEGHATESGKWWMQDDKLCLQVTRLGYDSCGKIVRTEQGIKLLTPAGDREQLVFGK